MIPTSRDKKKFEDYEGFVEKFKPKKTTDDCYTPQPVYNALLKWIDGNIMPLSGVEIVRPFYSGGDYEHFDYKPEAVVIDNPPFSIQSKICRFYNTNGIKYFLFAPTLSLFSSPLPSETYIVTCASIRFENGATVNVSFRTNMIADDTRIMLRGDLKKIIEAESPTTAKKVRKINYPDNVISAATLGRLVSRGIIWSIPASDTHFIRRLDNSGGVYGGGYLLSERAASERAVLERAATERAATEQIAVERAERVTLSDREWQIIKSLGHDDEAGE